MKNVMDLFTGANLWAWAFIAVAIVILGAISNHQKRGSEHGEATPKQ